MSKAVFTGRVCVSLESMLESLKLQAFRPATLSKRYSNTGAFL